MAALPMMSQISHWWDFPQWNPAENPEEKRPPLSFRIAHTYDPSLVYSPDADNEEEDVDLMAQLNLLRERKAQKTKERILQERAQAEKDKLARAEAKIKMLQDQREEKPTPPSEVTPPAEEAPEEPKKKRKRSMIGKKKRTSEEKRAKKLEHQKKKEFLLRTQSLSSIDPNKKIDFRAEAAAVRTQQPWNAAPAKPPKRLQKKPSVGSSGAMAAGAGPAAVARESSPEVPAETAPAEPGPDSGVNVAPSAGTSSPSVGSRRAPPKRESLGTMTTTIQIKSKLEKLNGMLTEIEDQTTAGECSQWEAAKKLVAEMLNDIASTTTDVPARRAVPQRRTLVNASSSRSPNRRSLQVPRKSSSGSQNQPTSGLFAQVETAPIPSAETAVLMRNMSPRAPDESAPGAPPGSPSEAKRPVTSPRELPTRPAVPARSPRSTPPATSPRQGLPTSPKGNPPVVSPRRNPPSMVQAPDGSMVQNELPTGQRGRGRGRGAPRGGAVRGRALSGGRRGMARPLSSPNFGRKLTPAADGSPILAPAEEAALPPVEKIDQEMQDLIDDLLLTR